MLVVVVAVMVAFVVVVIVVVFWVKATAVVVVVGRWKGAILAAPLCKDSSLVMFPCTFFAPQDMHNYTFPAICPPQVSQAMKHLSRAPLFYR